MIITIKSLPPTSEQQLREARLGDELLCTAREPFFAAARVLQARGVPDNTPLTMRYHDNEMLCLSANLGKAASLAVEEGDHPPRFRKYRAFSS